MRILIVGHGGREHALLWKLRRDAPEAHFYITRGNGGTAGLAEEVDLAPDDVEGLAGWAEEAGIDLTVVGPELPLAAGVVDALEARGLAAFGPSAAAARIESSKAFAKELMQRYGIPTAAHQTFTDPASAIDYVRRQGGPIVVKASGLAAGKGAVVCGTSGEAVAAIEEIAGGALGEAGDVIVVEECMEGEELSVFTLCDGERSVTLLAAQDHKRIGEGDTGPNTGGMGAYAPVSIATPELLERIERDILQPTIQAMAAEGHPYRGVLYAGLMLTADGPRVIEFNCRFGDPEAQVILPLLESSLLEPMLAVASGRGLGGLAPPRWRSGAAVTTVLASGGYPGPYPKGVEITIPTALESEDVILFHAGTERRGGRLVTSGGRVLAITALGADVAAAAARSREAAERVEFEGRTLRRDIAWREIERTR